MVDRQVVEDVRRRVSPRDVLGMEGLPVNRQGFALCPFHGDKNPSLKVYGDGRGWYCFGCHAGGDVIKLVEHLHGIGFQAALMRLDVAFGLGIFATRPQSARRSASAAKAAEDYKCVMAWLDAEIGRLEAGYLDSMSEWLDCQRQCDDARARVDHGGEFTQEDADNLWDLPILREAAQRYFDKWREARTWRQQLRATG